MNAPRASIHAIAPDTFRISIRASPELFPGFSSNLYLVADERPLLFHTGPKKLFGLVRGQIETVLPIERLRYVAFSHLEADECGALADVLALAPRAQPVCGRVGAMLDVNDRLEVSPLVVEDGLVLELGRHRLVWQATPHLPHGWECGYFHDRTTGTLFCGDLFTRPGEEPLVTWEILEASDAFRREDDCCRAHGRDSPALAA